MLYLPHHSQEKIQLYFDYIEPKIRNAIANSTLSTPARQYLTNTKIRDIIFSKPQKLLTFHQQLIPLLFAGSNLRDYNKYCKIKKKQVVHRDVTETAIYNQYNGHFNELSGVFNYEKFVSQSKATSYALARILDQNTCSYCNRLYTVTIVVKDEITNQINDSSRITRPTYDHWYSKGKFPVLALSFYNLIPSCSVCNTSVKGDIPFSLKSHIHPYKKEHAQDFKFNYIHKDVHINNVSVVFPNNSKVGRTLKDLKIKDIYNGHSEYELKDLLELRYKYSENYLETLFNETFDIEVGKKAIYRLIFGVEYKEAHFHKRPFSKFKKDILEQLGIEL